MNQLKLLLLLAVLWLPLYASADNDDNLYYNPVMNVDCPDPSVVRYGDYFYVFSTGAWVYKSKDLVSWEYVGNAFESMPAWIPAKVQRGIWAPDINYIKNQFVMFYTLHDTSDSDGDFWNCGIGVAVAPTPDSKFTDLGKLFTAKEIGVPESIDPCYFEDDGTKYLIWGSFTNDYITENLTGYGIYALELDKNGTALDEDVEDAADDKVLLTNVKGSGGTNGGLEGTMIYKRNGYYYLLASCGASDPNWKDKYHIVVARSESLFGPYVNKEGSKNAFTTLIYPETGNAAGTGHCSEIIEDDAGQTWLLYHGRNIRNGVNDADKRVLYLDQILWDDNGWPYVENNGPSYSHAKPVFNTSDIRHPVADKPKSTHAYNLHGQRVGESYKGIVIKDGKKVVRK